jgi:hypothetical protein
MNNSNINQRTFGLRNSQGATLVARLVASSATEAQLVRELFLATLGRPPDDSEMQAALRNRRTSREDWLTDLQWALINKTEFMFNH